MFEKKVLRRILGPKTDEVTGKVVPVLNLSTTP
jgi:hypothetical protein